MTIARRRTRGVLLASLLLAGCAGGIGGVTSIRTLRYVSTLEMLDSEHPVYKDCRTSASQPAAVYKDWALKHHRILIRYWVVPVGAPIADRTRDEVRVDERDCAAMGMGSSD